MRDNEATDKEVTETTGTGNGVTNAAVTSLYTVTERSIDPHAETLGEYAAFKLGVTSSVLHYAKQLLPRMRRLLAEGDPTGSPKPWVLTSPAITAAPAAANLLCWQLHTLLQQELADPPKLSLVDMRNAADPAQGMPWKSGARSFDYATLAFEDRVAERQRMTTDLAIDPRFRDRSVIFVNDILVTGAHQAAMERYFERACARAVRWVYVIAVDPSVGRVEPRIEARFNHTSLERFIELLSCTEIEPTSKCIQRLLLLGTSEIEQLLPRLDAKRHAKILALVLAEGYAAMPSFRSKVELLQTHAPSGASGPHAGGSQ